MHSEQNRTDITRFILTFSPHRFEELNNLSLFVSFSRLFKKVYKRWNPSLGDGNLPITHQENVVLTWTSGEKFLQVYCGEMVFCDSRFVSFQREWAVKVNPKVGLQLINRTRNSPPVISNRPCGEHNFWGRYFEKSETTIWARRHFPARTHCSVSRF